MVFLLAPNTVYEFQVQAETAVGGGPFSTPRQFITPEHGCDHDDLTETISVINRLCAIDAYTRHHGTMHHTR